MSYTLNQYNQKGTSPTSATGDSNNLFYMRPLSSGTAARRTTAIDMNITSDKSLSPFYDECVNFSSPLEKGRHYYFHTKIKRLDSDQTFYVYLTHQEGDDVSSRSQYLKTITVQKGDVNDWVDFEIIFTPLLPYNCILFELQRTIEDLAVEDRGTDNCGNTIYQRLNVRYPKIIYEELSLINNIIPSIERKPSGFIKIGVQSHPGLMMCINGEEIHIGRTGIYELRNGIIVIDFFSVVEAATEDGVLTRFLTERASSDFSNSSVTAASKITMQDFLNEIANSEIIENDVINTSSRCIFGNPKNRSIDAFTLDYMYEIAEEE